MKTLNREKRGFVKVFLPTGYGYIYSGVYIARKKYSSDKKQFQLSNIKNLTNCFWLKIYKKARGPPYFFFFSFFGPIFFRGGIFILTIGLNWEKLKMGINDVCCSKPTKIYHKQMIFLLLRLVNLLLLPRALIIFFPFPTCRFCNFPCKPFYNTVRKIHFSLRQSIC